MHYDLIIITNTKLDNDFSKFNYKIFDNTHYLTNDYTLNNEITFDYAIIEDINSIQAIDILKDGNNIICNYYFQTNKEHIFFIGKENNSKKSIHVQVESILEFLEN